jgi:hypothetical protein
MAGGRTEVPMRIVLKALGGVFVAGVLSCVPAVVNAEDAAPSPEAATAPAVVAPGITESQRRGIIAATIPFGKDEGDGFWPLYREFRRDVGKLQDQRAKIVEEYSQIFRTMTADQAQSIVEESMRIDENIAKLKRDYLKKFRKFLPETKVARVFMIDDKINAASLAELMAKIPVAGENATQ